jgi:hypothetical protein
MLRPVEPVFAMRSTAALLLFAALAAPAAADTVYLVNGNMFEEVIAERVDGEVRIRMSHGEIVLPETIVARVEHSRSIWQEYDEREEALGEVSSTAREWLDLALWADEAGYERGMRQALLRAAGLDAALDGLAPLMGRIGHILDSESGEWLAEAVYMRRRGYRLWGNEWLPRKQYEARFQAHQQAEKRRREDDRQERIARAIEALVVAELSRAAEPDPEPEPKPVETRGPLAVYPGGYFPFLVPPAGAAPLVAGPQQVTLEDVANRQPGSLFPVQPSRQLDSKE